MKKTILVSCFLFLFSSFALAAPSPVVQVISYKEPLGMYFSLQGWGSGSVIDNQGHILTNNHVVDDGLGGISDDFSVCVTEDPALPPKCQYTASVVARDPEKDIALLRIDPKDIFGSPVNFSNFTILPIDYTYTAKAGDSVAAQGYPWVGANTITQTQGIVSGTYEYNDNTYIKTDTLIAGGNSGGPLIRDGKMVGVNTFLIGGFFDPALGYSLSISEARDFVTDALVSDGILQTNSPKFAPFLQTVTDFSTTRHVSDELVTFDFPTKYNVTTYIPGSYIEGQIAEESTTAVYSFSFIHFNTPPLKTPEDIRYFLSGQSFFPFWSDVKFKTVTIGGQSFYEVDTLGNTGGDKVKTQYVYFKIVNNTHLVLLQLSTPFSNESTYDAIQKNISLFLDGVDFPSQWRFSTLDTIDVTDAGVGVTPPENSLVDFRTNFFPYNGVISQFMSSYQDLFSVRTYLDNLWSFAQLSIVPNAFYTEWATATELLDRLKESPYFSQYLEADLVTYKGHAGFKVCSTGDSYSVTDEKNVSHAIAQCEIILLVGEGDSHFLSLFYFADKRHKNDLTAKMKEYLDKYLVFDKEEGLTDLGSVTQELPYSDVDNQSQEFKETLKNMLKYGMLANRPKFDGDAALTWWEYIRIHVWMIYHKKLTDKIDPTDPKSPTFDAIIRQIPVRKSAYVDSAKRANFELMLRMRLAGVKLSSYSESSLNQFQLHASTKFRNEWQKIEDFEYKYFMGQKMGPGGAVYYNSGYYVSDFATYYNPKTGLFREEYMSTSPIDFGTVTLSADDKKVIAASLDCSTSATKYFSAECIKKREETVWRLFSYSVLTKGDAINQLFPSMDFALWDAELAKKKLVKIEDEQ